MKDKESDNSSVVEARHLLSILLNRKEDIESPENEPSENVSVKLESTQESRLPLFNPQNLTNEQRLFCTIFIID